MAPAGWVGWPLAVIMALVGLSHAGRLASPLPTPRGRARRDVDVDLTHVAMAAAMAVMLLGRVSPADSGRFALVFAIPTGWFVTRALRDYAMLGAAAAGHNTRQALGCCAMVYMLVAGASMAAITRPSIQMTGMAMGERSGDVSTPGRLIGTVLLLATAVVAIRALRTLLGHVPGLYRSTQLRSTQLRSTQPRSLLHGPVLFASCQLAMDTTAVVMLTLAF